MKITLLLSCAFFVATASANTIVKVKACESRSMYSYSNDWFSATKEALNEKAEEKCLKKGHEGFSIISMEESGATCLRATIECKY